MVSIRIPSNSFSESILAPLLSFLPISGTVMSIQFIGKYTSFFSNKQNFQITVFLAPLCCSSQLSFYFLLLLSLYTLITLLRPYHPSCLPVNTLTSVLWSISYWAFPQVPSLFLPLPRVSILHKYSLNKETFPDHSV